MATRKVKEAKVLYEVERKAPFDIKERTFLFSVRVVKLVGRLPKSVAGIEVGRQLIACGTSVGANVEEAHGGESKKDFAHKMGIAKKEARESRYWLRIVKATLLDDAEVDTLIQEADELVRILATIIHKTRRTAAV
jgi:four helix bundle protein